MDGIVQCGSFCIFGRGSVVSHCKMWICGYLTPGEIEAQSPIASLCSRQVDFQDKHRDGVVIH